MINNYGVSPVCPSLSYKPLLDDLSTALFNIFMTILGSHAFAKDTGGILSC